MNSRRRFRRGIGHPVAGVHAVVVGHSRLGSPRWMHNVLCIETGGWADGHFTILDAATLQPAVRPSRGEASEGARARPAKLLAAAKAWSR